MYIALSIITVMLIVLFAFFVLKACEENSKKSGYIIIPVNKDTTEKKLAKAVKRAYFEESFNGLDNMRTIIITGIDIDDNKTVLKLCSEFSSVITVETDRLSDYFLKKEFSDDQ